MSAVMIRSGGGLKNQQAANAVNYDEAKANPFTELPQPQVVEDRDRISELVRSAD